MNPDTGDMKNLTDFLDGEKEAIEKGYTEIFSKGEVIQIKGCFFMVNNFVEDYNFMNLKLISKKEAKARL